MATGYGGWIGGDDWRAIVIASVANKNDTTCTVTVTGRLESVYAYSSQWQGTLTSSGSGGTNTTEFACSTYQTVDFKTNTFDVTRGKSATTVTVRCAVYNSNYGETSTATATVTIPAKTSYAVTYDANGGSGAPTSQTKWHGEALTLSTTKPTRTGYTFAGWNTNSGGTGTNYAAGASYTGNAALKLYAKWTASEYAVKYAANGGSTTPANQTKVYGVALTLRAAIARASATSTFVVTYNANGGTCSTASHNATKTTSYAFAGWKSSSNGTTYAASGSYTTNAATTMTAQWTSSTSTAQVTLPTPTRTNYSFNGWYTAASGGTKVGNAGAKYTPTANVTLYAQWTLAYTAPTITKLTAKRCTSAGVADDNGEYCSLSVSWTAGTHNVSAVTFKVGTVTKAGTISGTSATAVAGTSTNKFDTGTRYAVTVELSDGVSTAKKTTVLSPSFFTLDFLSGGRGIALGMAAIAEGLLVGFVSKFYDKLQIVSNNMQRGVVPSTIDNGNGLYFADVNEDWIGRVIPSIKEDGREGVQLGVRRSVNGSNVTHNMFIGVDASGNLSVGMYGASNIGAAWRSAIGVGTIGTKDSLAEVAISKSTSVASNISAASGITVSTAQVATWGKMAQVLIIAKPNAAKSGTWTVGTMTSGFHPALVTFGTSNLTAIEECRLGTDGAISVAGTLAANTSVSLSFTYLLA